MRGDTLPRACFLLSSPQKNRRASLSEAHSGKPPRCMECIRSVLYLLPVRKYTRSSGRIRTPPLIFWCRRLDPLPTTLSRCGGSEYEKRRVEHRNRNIMGVCMIGDCAQSSMKKNIPSHGVEANLFIVSGPTVHSLSSPLARVRC